MKQTIYRTVTAKRRTTRPKAKAATAKAFNGMLGKLGRAQAVLAAARGRR